MDNSSQEKRFQAITAAGKRARRIGIVAVGLGLGSLVAYLISRVLGSSESRPAKRLVAEHVVDDRGTGQEQAAAILLKLRDRAFEASDEKLAVALGRPVAEVVGWNSGSELIDDDAVMKARGIALIRGVRVE